MNFYELRARCTGGSIALVLALLAAPPAANAQKQPATDKANLPPAVTEALQRAKIPLENVAVLVKDLAGKETLIEHNIAQPMNPASVMKLVTTFSALDLLGPGFTWKTEVLADGEIKNGVLRGDLILKGSGDPKLTIDRVEQLIKQLQRRGLTTIKGDLVLDKSVFGEQRPQTSFDGETLRAYNVGPDALLVNFKTLRIAFAPAFEGKRVMITPDVKPAQLELINTVNLIEAPCGDWRERIVLDVRTVSATKLRVSFTGSYPRACGERFWNVSVLDHSRFAGGVFAERWASSGGTWEGAVRVLTTPTLPSKATSLAMMESVPLSDIVQDINKYSNNVMARQLLLTMGAVARANERDDPRVAGVDAVTNVLQKRGINTAGLVIDNGSGLSRIERASAQTIAQLLEVAFRSSVMPEFMSSLSIVGVDGTFRRRSASPAAGQAHLKSGTLNDVSATAGYVLDAQGRRMVVVVMVNHNNAVFAQAAHDALLAWVMARP